MDSQNLVHVGKILKPHGITGFISAHFDFLFKQENSVPEHFFIGHSNPLPYFIESIQQSNQKILCKFEEIDSRDQADGLRNQPIFISKKEFEEFFSERMHPYEALATFELFDQDDQLIGTIEDIYSLPNQYLAQLIYKDSEVLIPLSEETVIKIDTAEQKVFVRIPEGLLEINSG